MDGQEKAPVGRRKNAIAIALVVSGVVTALVGAFLIDFSHSRNDCIRSEVGDLPFSRFCDPGARESVLWFSIGGSGAAALLAVVGTRLKGRAAPVLVALAVVALIAVWGVLVWVVSDAPAAR